jgi:hypothetical protein
MSTTSSAEVVDKPQRDHVGAGALFLVAGLTIRLCDFGVKDRAASRTPAGPTGPRGGGGTPTSATSGHPLARTPTRSTTVARHSGSTRIDPPRWSYVPCSNAKVGSALHCLHTLAQVRLGFCVTSALGSWSWRRIQGRTLSCRSMFTDCGDCPRGRIRNAGEGRPARASTRCRRQFGGRSCVPAPVEEDGGPPRQLPPQGGVRHGSGANAARRPDFSGCARRRGRRRASRLCS